MQICWQIEGGSPACSSDNVEHPEHTKLRRLGLVKVSEQTVTGQAHQVGSRCERSRLRETRQRRRPSISLLMSLAHAIWTCMEIYRFPTGDSSLFLSYSGLGGGCCVCLAARVGLLVARTHQWMSQPVGHLVACENLYRIYGIVYFLLPLSMYLRPFFGGCDAMQQLGRGATRVSSRPVLYHNKHG